MQAQTAQDKAGDYTQAAKDKAGDLTGSAKESAGQTQGKTGDYAQAAKDKTSSAADTLGSKVCFACWRAKAAHICISYRVVIAVFICSIVRSSCVRSRLDVSRFTVKCISVQFDSALIACLYYASGFVLK